MSLSRAAREIALLASLSVAVTAPAIAQAAPAATPVQTPPPAAAANAETTPPVAHPIPSPSVTPIQVQNPGLTSPGPANNGVLQIQGMPGENVPWSIVVLLTALTLIPSVLMCVTPFARLLIVFHFLRQALGLQTTPSNQTLIGLSLTLTFFIMQPVGAQIYQNSVIPMQAGKISAMEALNRGVGPMRKFMSHYVREKDVALFIELAKEPRPATVDDLSLRVLLPAYILSELKAGFQIGTVLFLPFLIVDMVVASITTSVGMLQLPPVVISTPLKLLLFLMVDGWHLLIGSLMRSFS
jgi:flagellar biosynthetic protein FliP